MAEVWEGRERGPRDLLPAVHRGDLPGTVCVYGREGEMGGVLDCAGRGTPYKGKGAHVCLVVYTVEPLYSGHLWDPVGCPV